MAELIDLYNLTAIGSALRNRITQATQIVATEIVLAVEPFPPEHAVRKKWAVAVISNHEHWGAIMARFLVAQYHASTIATIEGADTATLLDVVRAVATVFATEHAGG